MCEIELTRPFCDHGWRFILQGTIRLPDFSPIGYYDPMSASSSRATPVRGLRVIHGGGGTAAATSISDEALIDAVRRGDDRISDQLYDRLIGVVEGTLFRVLGCRESDHDDLIQEAFEQIVMTLTRRRFAGACSLATWASTVAAHVGLNALRSKVRERKVIDRSALTEPMGSRTAAGADVESQVHSRRELEMLRQELAMMRQEKASVVILHEVLGHDLAEIAAMTGASVAATQSRLVRGRRELAERLARRTTPRTEGKP